ncbi:MAG: response regulator, partial [Nitrosopumilus sp.]|nr:response regulator [Nitrosopumilus sp.]
TMELSEMTKSDSKNIKEFLGFLESNNKAKKIGDVNIISCNACNSALVGQLFSCPKCESTGFIQKDLYEHYSCGNMSVSEEYVDEKCPSCNKEITALGVDYRKIQNYFVCDNCDEKFNEPKSQYLCKTCDNSFSFNDSRLIKTENFSITDS